MTARALRYLLFASLAIAAFFVAYPNYVIRPQRYQGTSELQAALFVLRYQQLAELLCAIVALAAVVFYLRSKPSALGRIGAIASIVLVLGCAAFSRVNIYEILFHPAGAPSFQAAHNARLDGDEHLLTVNLAGPRAYPIREIAYHHIVNDVVGDVPIAVTY